jgi:hypothetical protein
VAKGRSRYDRGLLEGSGPQAVLPEDVDLFEAAPPRPRLSELLAALLADGGAGRPGSARDALERLEPAAGTLAAEPRQARAAAHRAEPGQADAEPAASAPALGRSGVVQVTEPDGTQRFGLVDGSRPTTAPRRLPPDELEDALRDLKGR